MVMMSNLLILNYQLIDYVIGMLFLVNARISEFLSFKVYNIHVIQKAG
jgi:hypothetical protein